MVPSQAMEAPLAGGSFACIRAAMAYFPPYLTIKADSPQGAIGAIVDAMEIITKKLGWCIIYKPATSGYIGGLLPNNTWDGAIGEVIRH
ncbi:Ionotropic receptor 153, partial [Hyalella azteca]